MDPLAARLARGDEAAFAELYDACADRLHRYLRVRLGSPDAASDVLQGAFLRAVKSRRRFFKVENPVAYMFQIARNEAARAASRERNRASQEPLAADRFAVELKGSSTLDDTEAAAAALARLDPVDREIVELKLYAGLTFREIAEVTAQPQATIATRYRRSLESLRPWLERQVK